MNTNFVLILFCAMVHSSEASTAPERVVNDILDSTAFNVAMFMMGWAATRRWTVKGNQMQFGLQWLKAMTTTPLLPPIVYPEFDLETDGTAAESEVKPGYAHEVTKPEASPKACPEVELELEPLPQASQTEDLATLLAGLSHILTNRVAAATETEMPPWRRSCFQSTDLSDWSLSEYMEHIHWFFECSAPCLVLSLAYLDRALGDNTQIALNSETCQRLFLCSLLAAAKFHDDDSAPYSNHFYADVAHVTVEELNAMEKQMCKLIDWRFYVGPSDYLRYKDLITAAASTHFAEEAGGALQSSPP